MTYAEQLITKARSALIMSQPFFGSLAMQLVLEESNITDTMATDGEKLYFSPKFVESLSEKELQGVCAHEVLHCANQHMTRRQDRDSETWNEACDYVINGDLLKAGFKLPKGALVNPRYDGLGAEECFALLQRKGRQKQSQGASGKNGDGQNRPGTDENGKAPDPGKCGGIIDAAPKHDAAKKSEIESRWKALTAQAIAVAKAQNAGQIPGYLERLAQSMKAPSVDWRELLRRFIDSMSRFDYTWTRPNRRHLHNNLFLPGTIPDGMSHLCLIIDVSGSVTQKVLDAFAAEAEAAMNEGGPDRVTVIYTDTDVCGVDTYERGDAIKLKTQGGGGTDFVNVFSKLNLIARDISAIIFLTDLYVTNFGPQPSAPVLWAVYGNPRAKNVPFGDIVHIN